MTFRRFEDVPAWKDAARFYVAVCRLTDDPATNRKGDWRDQLERASLSISNNIAEGFELGTTEQLIRCLYIAKGSAGECRSMLTIAAVMPGMVHLKSEISDLKSKAENLGRQLGAWCRQLQNSDIEGQRHLTDEGREREARRKRQSAIIVELKRITDEAREERERTKRDPGAAPVDTAGPPPAL